MLKSLKILMTMYNCLSHKISISGFQILMEVLFRKKLSILKKWLSANRLACFRQIHQQTIWGLKVIIIAPNTMTSKFKGCFHHNLHNLFRFLSVNAAKKYLIRDIIRQESVNRKKKCCMQHKKSDFF